MGQSRPDDLPIKLGPCSNGEFLPPPPSAVVQETVRRTRATADRHARRLGMSRRRFLHTACGSALMLLTLDACSREEAASNGGSAPGGSFATTLPPGAVEDQDEAARVLAGDEFIFDVQGHLLDYDLSDGSPYDGSPYLGQAFPQKDCGEDDPRACFSIEQFADLVFLQSDTSAVVLSALPLFGPDNPLSIESMERARAVIDGLCRDERVSAQGQAAPNLGDLEASLEAMSAMREQHDLAAWKLYCHAPADRAFFLDDHDPSAPQIGRALLDHLTEIGPPILCVHKGLRAVGGGAERFASPVDVGPAAVTHPDLSFVVYHSGYEADVTEGPYQNEGEPAGVDRLVRSLADAGVGAGSNVYAELGSTWRAVMGDPDQAAHVLGKLLVAVGPDRLVWGTDSIWYGSPQDQIEALRAFEITEEFQERFGYPALTPAVKERIFGLNSAELYGIEPSAVSCTFSRDELAIARQELALPFSTFGPTTAQQVDQLLVDHGAILA